MKRVFIYILTILFFSCQKDIQLGSDTGTGGSLARFTIVGKKMYIVTTDSLKTYDISQPQTPQYVGGQFLTWRNGDIETIFSFGSRLFIGSRTGMYLYRLDAATEQPIFEGKYEHEWGCDPVVANDSLAYVTIRNGRQCRLNLTRVNELQILDVKNFDFPVLIKTYPMTYPGGLALDKKILFVCDDGIRVLDVADPLNVKELKYLPKVDAIDVIPLDGHLLVIGLRKLTQFDYHDINNIRQISEFDLKQ